MTPAERFESLRDAGAEGLDPVQFHYAEALRRRLAQADKSLRPVLEEKLQRALDRLWERVAQAADAPRLAPSDAPAIADIVMRAETAAESRGLLALLNEHIRETSGEAGTPGNRSGPLDPHPAGDGLRSAGRFRESWGRMRADEDVEQAISRRPGEAGPLNSHSLLVSTLVLMRELSPDYLRRFLSTADALLWLEQQKGRGAGTG